MKFLLWLSRLRTQLVSNEDAGSIPGLAQCVKNPSVVTSCSVGRGCGSDPTLLWLWYRPAAEAVI